MTEIKPLSHKKEIKLLKPKLTKSIINIFLAVIALAFLVASIYFMPNEVDFKKIELFEKVALIMVYVAYIIMACCVIRFMYDTLKTGILNIIRIRKVFKLDKQLSDAITSDDKDEEVRLSLKIYNLLYELDVMSLNRKEIYSILIKCANDIIKILEAEFNTWDNRLYLDYCTTGSNVVEKTKVELNAKYLTTAEKVEFRLEDETIILPYYDKRKMQTIEEIKN